MTSRILIVDDDAVLLSALTRAMQLRMPEVHVDTCDSGLAAVQQILQADYDAVVSDIKMPGMDGLTLLDRIRELRPDLPTLLITGHGQHDLAVQALRGGAFDFIQKPIERDYFIASLSRAIHVRQMGRQLQEQQSELESHAAKLEQAVQKRTLQLSETNDRKDEFLAVLSHELRNPLACILNTAEFLSLSVSEQSEMARNFEVIRRQARQMTRLLDDLLDLSRVTRNKIELRKSPMAISRILEDAVSASEPMMVRRDHDLQISLDDEVATIQINADATRLEQVVVNLLNNAAKYTEPGGKIWLAARREGDELVLEVEDNGNGMRRELLPHIFEPFVQGDEHRRQEAEVGLGIGLTLVRQLVQLHDGAIEAMSPGMGKGSRFTIRLPIVHEPAPVPPAIPATSGSAPTRRVLLVEDQQALAQITRLLLERCGQEVVDIAEDGCAAVKAALLHHPDLVLLDIGLPGIDGYEAARQMRQYPQLDRTVLVATTGYGRQKDRKQAEEAGFDYHLVKPFCLEELVEVLQASREAKQPKEGAPSP